MKKRGWEEVGWSEKFALFSGIILSVVFLIVFFTVTISFRSFLTDFIISIFMFFFKISSIILNSVFVSIIFLTFVISLIEISLIKIINKKDVSLQQFLFIFLVVSLVYLAIFYFIPLNFASSLPDFFPSLIDLIEILPDSICCLPLALKSSFSTLILHWFINLIFYSTIFALIGKISRKMLEK